jgi:hypothetical protein
MPRLPKAVITTGVLLLMNSESLVFMFFKIYCKIYFVDNLTNFIIGQSSTIFPGAVKIVVHVGEYYVNMWSHSYDHEPKTLKIHKMK